MAPKKTNSQNFELMNYQIDELKTAQERTEGKVDDLIKMVGQLSYVSKKEYVEDQKLVVKHSEIESIVIKIVNKKNKPYLAFIVSVGTAVTIALVLAFVNFVVNGGLRNG